MSKKMLNPNTTLWAIPADKVTDPMAIKAEDLNGSGIPGTDALNFSCAVVRGYSLNPTDSDTDDSASICDSGNVENRLYDNYEGEFTMFRDGDVSDATSVFNKAFKFFKEPDKPHYIVRRIGKRNTEVAAADDEIEVFLFVNDRIRSVDGGDDGPIQFTVPELQQGFYSGYYKLAA